LLVLQNAALISTMPAIWLLGFPIYRFNLFGFKKDKTLLEASCFPFSLTLSFDRTKMLAEYKTKTAVETAVEVQPVKVSDQNEIELGEGAQVQKQPQQQQLVQQQPQQQQVVLGGKAQIQQQPQQQQVVSQVAQQIMIVCPPGLSPGAQLTIQTAAGPVMVIIPPGVKPGMQFPVVVFVPVLTMQMAVMPVSTAAPSQLLDFR